MMLNGEIVSLSRRNTNVRSLALSLGQRRMLTAGVRGEPAGAAERPGQADPGRHALARRPSTAMKRRTRVVVLALAAVAVAVVAQQAIATLRALTVIERERDTWQRPDDILRPLDLAPGKTVVDLGSGAGYFALKLSPRVGPSGRVLAVDLRRLSLAFLWVRAMRNGYRNLDVIHGRDTDPRLPTGTVDGVLIANTYHELAAPRRILEALSTAMRPGARLVVVDRGPRGGSESRAEAAAHHELTAAEAEIEINQQGFATISRDEHFIDRAGDEGLWWLVVFQKR